jgi:hypothetical protein
MLLLGKEADSMQDNPNPNRVPIKGYGFLNENEGSGIRQEF